MAFEDEEDVEFVPAGDNPDLAAAAQALTAAEQEPKIEDPLDGPVHLPAGFRRIVPEKGEQEVRDAWVRELNGEDEERIARAKLKDDFNAFLRTILECGVERLGDGRPTREDINLLTVGDQEFLLLEISRVTYGDDLTYKNYACPHCGKSFDVSLSLSEDIPVKRLDKVEDATFEVRLKNDRIATVNLPTGEVSTLVAQAENSGEANTILISHCVEEIRGPKGTKQIQGDVQAARKMGVADRAALVQAMGEKMPGPQYNEVRFKHEPGCGEEVRLGVSLADLFRSL